MDEILEAAGYNPYEIGAYKLWYPNNMGDMVTELLTQAKEQEQQEAL